MKENAGEKHKKAHNGASHNKNTQMLHRFACGQFSEQNFSVTTGPLPNDRDSTQIK